MITITQLINIAPFPEETKKELLSKSDTLSDSKKVELEELCWALISQWYKNELRARQEIATLEMAKGDGIIPGDFRINQMMLSSRGSVRKTIIKPLDFTAKLCGPKLILEFGLPKGSFATALLQELLHH